MIARSFDAEFLNSIVNHPDMEPARLGLKDLDLTEAVSNPDNYFLANQWGGFLCIKDGDVYEVHTNFLPAGRGKLALKAAQDATFFMFTRTDALALRTYVPKGNFRAAALTRRMGFSHWGDEVIHGHPCRTFVLTLKSWARRL